MSPWGGGRRMIERQKGEIQSDLAEAVKEFTSWPFANKFSKRKKSIVKKGDAQKDVS